MLRITALAIVAVCALSGVARDYAQYVNPLIGTGRVGGALSGNNNPAATVPFGMVQLGPDTHPAPDWFNASGYDYTDGRIYGFTHTRLSGTGASDLIDVSLFPTLGESRSSAFSHERETASPGYYRVNLDDENILAEMTATSRVGVHRYTFPADSAAHIIVDLDRSAQKGSWDRKIIQSQLRVVSPTMLTGYRVITGWAKLRKVYFAAEFSRPFEAVLSDGSTVRPKTDVINGRELRADLSFAPSAQPVVVKVGISAVSPDGAMANLKKEAEGRSFDEIAAVARKEWNDRLGAIDVDDEGEKATIFYTALYHAMVQPNLFSDVNGEYTTPVYSTARVPEGEEQYTTFSLWDTYRGAHPLYTLLYPKLDAAFVNSMLRHYDDYGYLPIWHLWGQDNYCMIGNHAIPVVVDAVLKGLPGIDPERAYEAVRQSSVRSHPNSPFDVWETYGYMPEPLQTQSVSITLEMAYNDWCVARLAEHLGKTDDAERFYRRAGFYKNLYDPSTGFFRARNEKGDWIEPFDPLRYGANGGYPYTEGNAWQYFWYVPHDVDAFVAMAGGPKVFEKKLDDFFTITDSSGEKNDNISGMIGQYAHGNEPSHHVAYLYNAVGASQKCRDLVARICSELYNTSPSGYAGNDDCGEMSAWYIFSALGFYPVNPADGKYWLGIPAFDKATINLPDGKTFTVLTTGNGRVRPSAIDGGAGAPRVKSVLLNGKPLKGYTISHSDILKGGTLEFRLG
ncbi:MAG: GH92 family glycosyl hydrolase [bacterium]|nr:GH92 family glycosyl hydrolase [bacterium]